MRTLYLFLLVCFSLPVLGQQSIGIGTTTPDNKAALDITSTTSGVLFPKLNNGQQTTLAGLLGAGEKGMLIIDNSTGKLLMWSGSAWQAPPPAAALTAKTPLAVTSNNVRINPGTAAGDLLTWDGTNWVNMQPAVQHFSVTIDNHQPYLAANYVISLFGIFPSQNDASQPYLGEIFLMANNFAPNGWHFCDGSLLPISSNTALFALVGTIYGGNGTSTFALPDLRGRVALHQGNNGTTNYTIGQSGGSEQKTFSH